MANDVDAKRAYILVRRLAPLGPACQKLVVTQHKAQKYPSLSHEREDRYLQGSFDRIICDVPCCGDGTLRKSPGALRHHSFAFARWPCRWVAEPPLVVARVALAGQVMTDHRCGVDMWRRWHPGFAIGLHTLQVRVALREPRKPNPSASLSDR